MKSMIKLFIFGASLAALAHWFSQPLPGFKDAWKLRITSIFFVPMNIMGGMASAGILSWPEYMTRSRQFFGLISVLREDYLEPLEMKIHGVSVLIFTPDNNRSVQKEKILLPGVIYYHGGGFTFFIKDVTNPFCSTIAKEVKAVVISVRYSLSPESKCPKCMEESLAVTRYILDHTHEFGIDPNRVVVMGDSAGGAIATSVAYRLSREQGRNHLPKYQVLLNPLLQLYTLNFPSYQSEALRPALLRKVHACFLASGFSTGTFNYSAAFCDGTHTRHLDSTTFASMTKFAPMERGKALSISDVTSPILPLDSLQCILDPKHFPFFSDDLNSFIPVYIATSEYDILKDEGLLFVHRLKKARAKVVHNHYNTYHTAFLCCPAALCTKEGIAMKNDVLSFLQANI